ncbi:hypothetical protein CPC08DRAFT_769072 [Agrocybe pediades]|nr:hypothetical protein CPC08DRAFT_769072 [Agrocybe pediades]
MSPSTTFHLPHQLSQPQQLLTPADADRNTIPTSGSNDIGIKFPRAPAGSGSGIAVASRRVPEPVAGVACHARSRIRISAWKSNFSPYTRTRTYRYGAAVGVTMEERKEKDRDGGMKMDAEPPLKAPSTTSISPTTSTTVMDVPGSQSRREKALVRKPPPQQPTLNLSRFDAQAFSAVASALVNEQHKVPPTPAFPPSSPIAAMSSPQLASEGGEEEEGGGGGEDGASERTEEAKEEQEVKVDKQTKLVAVETRQAKMETIVPVVPPARVTRTPTVTPVGKGTRNEPV